MPTEERCVMCDAIIPEGSQVCPICRAKVQERSSRSPLTDKKTRCYNHTKEVKRNEKLQRTKKSTHRTP